MKHKDLKVFFWGGMKEKIIIPIILISLTSEVIAQLYIRIIRAVT